MSNYTIQLEETWLDYPSPEGNAIIVYFTGCSHHCLECHSPLLQEIRAYSETNEQICQKIQDFAKRADTNKLVFLGGDPLHPSNQSLNWYLCTKLGKDYDICIFTGYDINYVKQLNLTGVKYYKCGVYDKNLAQESKKTDEVYVLASSNQNFYDSNYQQLSQNGILYFNN